ncbi:aspartate aminotransferase family protein [Planctomicrobium sp.]|jgi:acetylornithine/N-succinyldiaminopimelate aminotransferase|nr:aspartate aminotransferase family protein [Planctomicrobium sp.]MDA7528120.1 aspartate aminotransferase family protein [bacterium]MDB4743573.1 aspartate aminotransferase family protein [Planctomicrobium sp.]
MSRTSQETISLFDKYVIPNYGRYPISLVRGEGSHVFDAEGKEYLDLFPGWGCNILGYSPQRVIQAVQEQVAKLIHVPNTWYMEPQGEFAEAICSRSFGKAFFCNSGAEAIEGAIKLARLHTPPERYKIITFENGFHGRTYGAVTATAQPKYHKDIGPMMAGFSYAPHNDLDAVRQIVDKETAAILIEPVQGEGGVNTPADGFLQGLREICDENDMVLIFDEVQTGMGRTGNWFAHQTFGVQPDIMTMAKGIAAGVACGAIIAKDEVAPSLRPGMHASTFGGNPIAMVAGKATVETIEEENLLENCKQISARFKEFFDGLKEELSIIEEVRVCGAMIGVDLGINAMPAVKKAMERGLLLNATHDTVVRLLPALNITDADVTHGCEIIAEVLKEMADEASGA